MICIQCNQETEDTKSGVCSTCKRAATARYSHIRANNNWMELAEQAGVDLWERQPGETDDEYGAWALYRDAYPGKKPTLKDVAEATGRSVASIQHISKRWNFTLRMQAWVKHVDTEMMNRRRNDIITMNDKHMTMAHKLNDVIACAINNLRPEELSPKDINALMKTAQELERKARVDQYEIIQAGNPNAFSADENPDLKKNAVKSGDIGEIVKILAGAGALDNVGIRQTVTTEVVKRSDD